MSYVSTAALADKPQILKQLSEIILIEKCPNMSIDSSVHTRGNKLDAVIIQRSQSHGVKTTYTKGL